MFISAESSCGLGMFFRGRFCDFGPQTILLSCFTFHFLSNWECWCWQWYEKFSKLLFVWAVLQEAASTNTTGWEIGPSEQAKGSALVKVAHVMYIHRGGKVFQTCCSCMDSLFEVDIICIHSVKSMQIPQNQYSTVLPIISQYATIIPCNGGKWTLTVGFGY